MAQLLFLHRAHQAAWRLDTSERRMLMLCISAQFASHGWLWRSAAMTLRMEGRQPPAL